MNLMKIVASVGQVMMVAGGAILTVQAGKFTVNAVEGLVKTMDK